MSRNKLLFGLIGLALGFIISFFMTKSYNNSQAGPVARTSQSGAMASGGAPDQQGMMANVRDTLEKAKNNPKDFNAQVDAARMYFNIGRIEEAIEYLKKAYDINSSNANVAFNIANLYFEQANYSESENWYRRALGNKPNDPQMEAAIHVELAAIAIQREPAQPDKAIGEIQQALKTDPKDSHALVHLTEAYLLKKNAAAAEEALNRLKQADPSHTSITTLQNMLADVKAGRAVTIPKE